VLATWMVRTFPTTAIEVISKPSGRENKEEASICI